MNKNKVLFRILGIGIFALAVVFVLLFIYVDTKYWKFGGASINATHTVVATVGMAALGVGVCLERNWKHK